MAKVRKTILGIFIFGILLLSLVSSQFSNPSSDFSDYGTGDFSDSVSSWQYARPNFNTYYPKESVEGKQIGIYDMWPILRDIENEQCTATSDFLIAIRPGGCTPMVVRSDLLEERNVPVFCQLDAVKVNPLIKVSSIKSISFKGEYPEDVAGVNFHPARAAIRSYRTLLGSPLLNNIGYVVIILKKQEVEEEMPDWVSGNLTATIYYDAENVYGTGKAEYYAPVMSDEEWEKNYQGYGFWYGRGFLRVKDIEEGGANIVLYTDKETEFQNIILKTGETSSLIYFPGFYCRAGLRVKLNKIVSPEKQAKLNIDGQDIWVREGSRILNNKCRVNKISALSDSSGSVSISCPGQKINLMLQRAGAEFLIGDVEKKVGLGEKVESGKVNGDNEVLYLGYVGVVPDSVSDEGGKQFVLLVDSKKVLDNEKLAAISQGVGEISELEAGKISNLTKFETELGKAFTGFFGTGKVHVLVRGESLEVGERQVSFIGLSEAEDKEYEGDIEDYFDLASQTTERLVDEYGSASGDIEKYGEQSLIDLARLSETIGKPKTAEELYQRFVEQYPDSKNIEGVRRDLFRIRSFDSSRAFSTIFLNNNYHDISVERFKEFDKQAKKVWISAGNFNDWAYEGDKVGLGKNPELFNSSSYISVDEIEINRVILKYHKYEEGEHESPETIRLEEKDSVNREGIEIVVRQLHVEKVAYISLIPEVKNTKTQTNFTFKIGIEKRAIKLSPEKTKEIIENLNETIKDWEEVNDKLGKVIKGWKGACFATSSLLMMKNLFSGFSGETIARQKVMKAYRDICSSDPDYRGLSRTECYNRLAEDINRDVSLMHQAIDNINKDISVIEANHQISEGWLGIDKVIDSEGALEDYKRAFRAKYGDEVEVRIGGEVKIINVDSINSFEQLREAELLMRLRDSDMRNEVLESLQETVDSHLNSVYRLQESERLIAEAEARTQGMLQIPFSSYQVEQEVIINQGGVFTKQELIDSIGFGGEVVREVLGRSDSDEVGAQIVYSGTQSYLYLFEVRETQGSSRPLGLMEINNISERKYNLGGEVSSFEETNVPPILTISGKGFCSNKYLEPRVRFYETSPNVKLPAIVPFDLDDGWYVRVPQSIGGLFQSQKQGYYASGDVSFFYICNVGENGREENMRGDDRCQSFDVNTYNKVDSFIDCPDLSPSDVQRLIVRARQALREAAQQYGNNFVKISGVAQRIEVDAPLVGDGELVECQDFMSPEDCMLLFNTCDPVICPPSRCNLAGKWPVANVVQTGIIGSLVLCLPNAREGILVPICLTGVHAGVDNLISIMKSYRECLQESLETGKHVGICDEIQSIYLCEFFWRQIAPVIRYFIPRIIEAAYGYGGMQGARGGGEYLTVMQSWDNLERSIEFFKNEYAQNAFRAFQFRSIEEAGGVFCKAFIGTSLPTSVSLIDSLLEPESPEQVYAWFSETEYTDATVPATSQYKVYFHIYAGRDKGVQYSVYLRDPPASSYYAVNPVVHVKSGYIAREESADETIDFTAPAGYKELCVVLDAQTYCGFRQVTTDFALQYLQKKYVEEQAEKKGITTEKECISGSPSIYPLISPNIQAGAEEAIQPEIALRGIVRICATNNPGSSVSGENVNQSRWVEVGYCDNPNIKCWLDRESVRKDVEQIKSIEENLAGAENGLQDIGEGVLTPDATQNELNILRQNVRNLNVGLTRNVLELGRGEIDKVIGNMIGRLDMLIGDREGGRAYSDQDIAEALSLKANVYRNVVRALFNEGILKVVPELLEVDESDLELDEISEEQTEEYSEKEIFNLTFGNKTYYLKFGRKSWWAIWKADEWLFSFNNKSWNDISEDNVLLNFLSEKDFEEGVEEIELREESVKLESDGVTDEMLEENVDIVLVDPSGREDIYRYDLDVGWISNVVNDTLVRGRGYLDGLKQLVAEVSFSFGRSLKVGGKRILDTFSKSNDEIFEEVVEELSEEESVDVGELEEEAEEQGVLIIIRTDFERNINTDHPSTYYKFKNNNWYSRVVGNWEVDPWGTSRDGSLEGGLKVLTSRGYMMQPLDALVVSIYGRGEGARYERRRFTRADYPYDRNYSEEMVSEILNFINSFE